MELVEAGRPLAERADDPILADGLPGRELYKQRNRIERCFNALKHFRRFSTRYCRII